MLGIKVPEVVVFTETSMQKQSSGLILSKWAFIGWKKLHCAALLWLYRASFIAWIHLLYITLYEWISWHYTFYINIFQLVYRHGLQNVHYQYISPHLLIVGTTRMTQMYCLWNPQAPYRHGNCCRDGGEATPLKYGQMYLMRCLDWGRDHWGELQLNRETGSLYYFSWFVAVVNPENHCTRDAKLLNVFLFFGIVPLFIYYLRVRERERAKREHCGFGNDLILVCADNSF